MKEALERACCSFAAKRTQIELENEAPQRRRIKRDCVNVEIVRLKRLWSAQNDHGAGMLAEMLDAATLAEIDPFDRVQLAETIRICRNSRSLSEAGRSLFAASRTRRSTANDADRLKKYLARFGLDWGSVSQE